MFEDEKIGKIENLKKGLYSKNTSFFKDRSKLPKKDFNIKENWDDDFPPQEEVSRKTKKQKTFIEKALIAAILFFILSAGIVFVTFFGGINNVSTKNVDITVVGPTSIESGGELSMQVTITNNNPTDLELADLIIEYPSGTHSVEQKNEELSSARESLDLIPSGRSIRKEFKSVLYGEENSEKEIIISLEYRIAGSNAIFFKDRKYEIKISSSPVNLIVSPIEEVISGQDINFSVSVMSNSENLVEDLLLVAEYPFGFEFKKSTPKPSFGNNVWDLKDLDSEDKDVINIEGSISGQDDEERVFRFTSGTRSSKSEKEIGAIFASVVKSIFIKKPFMGIDVAINGDSSLEYVSDGNRPIRVDVTWSNNSPSLIVGGEIRVKLNGAILDKNSVSVDKGFYRSIDNTIIWDKNTNGELSEISPGDSGRFSFSFLPLGISSRSSFVNPEISVDVSAKGNRVSEENITETIDSSLSRIVKFSSDLMVTPRATFYTGPFSNNGPIPPRADQETTYTITWTITNTSNNVSGVKVSSSLPAYVRWMGVVSPSSENISYNPVGGSIVWDAGEVKAGTGIKTSSREISFQVALLPSLTQVGDAPDLTSDVSITGIDRFTNSTLKDVESGVGTRLNTDPGFSSGGGVVVE